jgi:hypothetical protein
MANHPRNSNPPQRGDTFCWVGLNSRAKASRWRGEAHTKKVSKPEKKHPWLLWEAPHRSQRVFSWALKLFWSFFFLNIELIGLSASSKPDVTPTMRTEARPGFSRPILPSGPLQCVKCQPLLMQTLWDVIQRIDKEISEKDSRHVVESWSINLPLLQHPKKRTLSCLLDGISTLCCCCFPWMSSLIHNSQNIVYDTTSMCRLIS